MRELYRDVSGPEVSCGNPVNTVRRFASKAGDISEEICSRIAKSPVVGGDETGVCIGGKNRRAWTFQTPRYTFIDVDFSRGKKVIDKLFGSGFPQSATVHDCRRPCFKADAQNHQIRAAHLLRELKYPDQLYNDEWSAGFTQLLKEALQLKKEPAPVDYLYPVEKRKQLEVRLDKLLQEPVNGKHDKLPTFQNRMKEYQQ